MEEGLSAHERLADRLVKIIVRLNSGEKLHIHQLAQEFKTHPRTIKRDFARLETTELPILHDEKTKTIYLNPIALGNFGANDIVNFAQLSGVQKLYPRLNFPFLRELLDNSKNQVYTAKGYTFEDASLYSDHFKKLNDAIQNKKWIRFFYKNLMRTVKPYRLIHHHGCWYLAAVEQEELKTYRLGKITGICFLEKDLYFKQDAEILRQLENEDTIWFSNEKKIEVILAINPKVTSYFIQRSLFPEQQVVKYLDDGGLLISSQISHYQQILPLVRYWIPNIKIIDPVGLQEELKSGLEHYLGGEV